MKHSIQEIINIELLRFQASLIGLDFDKEILKIINLKQKKWYDLTNFIKAEK